MPILSVLMVSRQASSDIFFFDLQAANIFGNVIHLERGKLVARHDGLLLAVRRGEQFVNVALEAGRVFLEVGKLLAGELEGGP